MTATRPETIRLTQDSTRAEIAEALRHLNHRTKRELHVVGECETADGKPMFTKWDERHHAINEMLTDYCAALS